MSWSSWSRLVGAGVYLMDVGRLTIIVDEDPLCPRVVVDGELDEASAPGAAAYIARAIGKARQAAWSMDLAGVSFVGTSGLQVLQLAQRALGPHGSLLLVDPSASMLRLLELTGMARHFVTTPPERRIELPLVS